MSSLAFSYAVDGAGVTLHLQAPRRGLLTRLLTAKPTGDLQHLLEAERDVALALADVRGLAADDPRHLRIESEHVWLSHDLAARVPVDTGILLGLPQFTDLLFECGVEGTLGSPTFRLTHRWTRAGRDVETSRRGVFLRASDGERRLPLPVLQALGVADGFDRGERLEAHWAALARFRAALDGEAEALPDRPDFAAKTRMTAFLGGLKISLADALSLKVFDGDGGLDFDPVPFSRRLLAENAVSEPDEGNGLLHGEELDRFQRSVRERGATPAYRLGENRFVVIDPGAAPALEVMAQMQRATPKERDAFARNPRQAISEAYARRMRRDGAFEGTGGAEAEAIVEAAAEPVFIETSEYSARVIGIGQWRVPDMPVRTRTGTTWLPEVIEEPLRAKFETMSPEALADILERAEAAWAAGEPSIKVDDAEMVISPASLAELRALQLIADQLEPSTEETPAPRAADRVEPASGPVVLQTRDNLSDLDWLPDRRPRASKASEAVPDSVTTVLKDHQVSCFEWAVSAWKAGLPGVLIADEQGLGKTLQTLAFLAWLRSTMAEPASMSSKPTLIVAPTSLLENWEAEVRRHMSPEGLGRLTRIYGTHIAGLKQTGAGGLETNDGVARLSLPHLQDDLAAGNGHRHWVLTTYTTLTNYQHSLGQIPFGTVVFDEIQNLKNPASLRANAGRAVNADFRVGLTGTPIENRTADLWAVIEQVCPGALGTLVDFDERYGDPTRERMQELRARVFDAREGRPALGLRRLKSEVATDLPGKYRVLHPRIMPEPQAEAYLRVRATIAAGTRGGALAALHRIRSVSVHPGTGLRGEDEAFIAGSARMAAAMDILDTIHIRRERALVFIEHRKLQYRFAELARLRYRLQEVPVINGDTPIPKRQKTVDRFQRHLEHDEGFDLLVLGPRAAGTGLTLTAASHVIHLSRWWNPAVEEQCNDRAHRIGQQQPVTVHLPLAIHPEYRSQSFDCLLERLMRRKRDLADSVLWPAGDTNEDVTRLQADLTAHASVLSPTLESVRDDLTKRGAKNISANVYCLPPLGPDAPNVLVGVGADELEIRRAMAAMASSTAWATAFVTGFPPSGISSLRISDTSLWPEFVDSV